MEGAKVSLRKSGSKKGYCRAFVLRIVLAAAIALSLGVVSGLHAAEAPEWSPGFPRIAEMNVLLQWNPVKGATEYKVYRTESADKDLKLLTTVKPNRHIDKDVPTGKKLYYYVVAVVDGAEGPRSKPGSVTVQKEEVFVPLKRPTLEGAIVKSGGKEGVMVGIRWEGGQGTKLVGYNIYRSKKKGSGYALIGSTVTNQYDDEDVKHGDTYYYVVTAMDSDFVETAYSNEVSAELPKPVVSGPLVSKKQEKKEAKPTKLRAAKVLFTIPPKPEYDKYFKTGVKPKGYPMPSNAQDVVVDEAVGHIYVTSYGYGGILVYDMKGKFQFGVRKDGVNGEERFVAPENLALGPNGNVYLTDYDTPDLYVFNYEGKHVDTLTVDISHVPGREKSKAALYGVAVADDGSMYVTDPRSNRVYGYTKRKKLVMEAISKLKTNLEFSGPSFMIINPDGDLTFTDAGTSRLLTIDRDGKFKQSIGKRGLGAGFTYYPVGLASGNDKEIFIASALTPNIQAFATDGKFLYLLANEKFDGAPTVNDMRGIYVDSQNRVYVTEGLMNRVTVLQLLDKYEEKVMEE